MQHPPVPQKAFYCFFPTYAAVLTPQMCNIGGVKAAAPLKLRIAQNQVKNRLLCLTTNNKLTTE